MKTWILLVCVICVIAACGVYPQTSRDISDPKYRELLVAVEGLVTSGELPDSDPIIITAGSRYAPIIFTDEIESNEKTLAYQLVVPLVGFRDVQYVHIVFFDNVIDNVAAAHSLRILVLEWVGNKWERFHAGRVCYGEGNSAR